MQVDSSLIISSLTLIIVFVSLLFSIFLFTVKTLKRLSNVLMACFLLVIAIDISVYVYYDLISLPPYIEMLRIRISAFKSPLLFLYILSIIYSDFKLKLIHLVHLLPFVIGVAVLLPRFFWVEIDEQLSFFENYRTMPEIRFIRAFGSILTVLYLVADIYFIRKYKKVLLENYTTGKAFFNYKWLSQLIIIIVSISAITFVKDLLKLTTNLEIINLSRIVMLVGGLIFICWLVLKALYAPKHFSGVNSKFQLVKNIIDTNSQLPERTKTDKQIDKIQEYITLNEPFLDPTLTMQKLADQLHIPAKDLSILINHHLNKHFFDFINEFRIKKAMQILKDPSSKDLTILEILFDVGFNSKTPFNTAFKKYTKMTPTQYKQSVR